MPKLRFSIAYALAAAALFVIEAAIAVFVHSGFVRHTLGDALAAALLYAGLLSIVKLPRPGAAAMAFTISLAIEIAQAAGLPDRLGLAEAALARLILGATFSWTDIAAYAAGASGALAADYACTAFARRR